MDLFPLINLITVFFNTFFFDYYVSSNFIGFYRIIACSSILIYLISIHKDIIIFINPSGIYPYNEFKKSYSYNIYKLNIFHYFKSVQSTNIIIYCFYLFGLASVLGFFTNLSLIIFYYLFFSLQKRIGVINSSGGDVVANVILLCLIFLDSGHSLSLDSIIFSREYEKEVLAWPLRLIQITISFGYFWSSLSKLNSKDWIDGVAIKNAICSSPYGKHNFPLIRNNWIAYSAGISVVIFQVLSPLLFWVNEFRLIGIIWGISLHLIMIFTLRIGYFGPIMIVGILSFAASYF
jgi:hypothetical protein